MGQPFHKIAVAGKDIRIWEVQINKSQQKVEAKQVACFDQPAEVWRVEWNSTGTILASSGDDGCVRFWKSDFTGQWKRLLEVKPEPARVANSTAPTISSSSNALQAHSGLASGTPFSPGSTASQRSALPKTTPITTPVFSGVNAGTGTTGARLNTLSTSTTATTVTTAQPGSSTPAGGSTDRPRAHLPVIVGASAVPRGSALPTGAVTPTGTSPGQVSGTFSTSASGTQRRLTSTTQQQPFNRFKQTNPNV